MREMGLFSHPRKPFRVLHGKDPGITFISDPDDEIVRKMNRVDNWNALMIAFLVLGIPMIFGPLPFMRVNMDMFYYIVLMLGLLGGAFLMLFMVFLFAMRSDRKKPQKKMEICSFVKVFDTHMGVYQHTGRWDIMNMIPIDQIKGIHFDAEQFLKKKGYKWRNYYYPFFTLPPSPKKGKELFYLHVTPTDHLVRIEFKKRLKVLNHDPDIKGNWMGMPLYQGEYDLKNLIVSIKPKEQERFRSFVMGK
jgi:hypothetical protein